MDQAGKSRRTSYAAFGNNTKTLDVKGNTTLASSIISQSSDPDEGRGGLTSCGTTIENETGVADRSVGQYQPEFLTKRWANRTSIVDAPVTRGHYLYSRNNLLMRIRSGHGSLQAATRDRNNSTNH